MAKRQKVLGIQKLNLNERNNMTIVEPDYIQKRQKSNHRIACSKAYKIISSGKIKNMSSISFKQCQLSDSKQVLYYFEKYTSKD